jgi:hypothetical protein
MRRSGRRVVFGFHLAVLLLATDAAAASRSANLSVVATVAVSCASPPQSVVLTCTKGAVTQVQITPLTTSTLVSGTFFRVPGPARAFSTTPLPSAVSARPEPRVISGMPADASEIPAAFDGDGDTDTVLITINF